MTRLPLVLGLALAALTTNDVGPNRYGHSDRVERHMLPVVAVGPTDPAWSPDGQSLAFAMRGDVWRVPADGGPAVALTRGPAYHFEPAWSPDGQRIALTLDTGGNLDVGIVSTDGGDVQRLTTSPGVDVEPAWSADGQSLFYVTARGGGGGGFMIVQRDLATGVERDVVRGIEPAVSPDGTLLAYVADVPGRLGTGGLWVKPLTAPASAGMTGEPRLVHYEETEYRARPTWTPDGQALLFVSDEGGSNDVMLVPLGGGNPQRLTADPRDEYTPSANRAGTRIAFVSNHAGATTLYTAPIGGGPRSSWQAVPLRELRPRVPDGRLHVRVLGPDGRVVPARITVEASDGRAYAPDGGFHRVIAATETHYFHADGDADVDVPAGRTLVEAARGFEYRPVRTMIDVPAGGRRDVTLRLTRLIDLPARGWWSGDTHVHDLHQGMQGLTHESFFAQLRAEDLHVTNALIHMDGTRLMGRWEDLTGKPSPLSTPDYVLQYGEEYRGSFGHVSMLGVRTFIMPLTGGVRETAYAQPELDARYVDEARTQGGIGGFGHPYLSRVSTPAAVASTLIPVDVALGSADFYDVTSLYSDEVASTEVYYRLLNCGFRLPATGGSDNFSDAGRDPPPGADRTYVRLPLGTRPTLRTWLDGIKAQHTFSSTGPLVLLDVAGRGPGDEIALPAGAPTTLRVRASAASIAPMERLDVVVNGEVVHTARAAGDSSRLTVDTTIAVPSGGWVAARVLGPSSRYVTDSYAFAQTSPVYVVRGGRRFTSVADARFLVQTVDAIRTRVERGPWRSDAERARFMAALDRAKAVYERIAGGL